MQGSDKDEKVYTSLDQEVKSKLGNILCSTAYMAWGILTLNSILI